MKSIIILSLILSFCLVASSKTILFGLTSNMYLTGEQYETTLVRNYFDLQNSFSNSTFPKTIAIADLSKMNDTKQYDIQAYKAIVQSSGGRFIFTKFDGSLSSIFSTKNVNTTFVNTVDEINKLNTELNEKNNGDYILYFIYTSSSETSTLSSTATKTGKYLTPDVLVAVLVFITIILGIFFAYTLVTEVQTPTTWVEKIYNVGKVY
ncbi:hypothetical protein WA158_006598 [Blastocystis sp. Blastoise]